MKAVDVLRGVDGHDDASLVDVLGERELNENAVNGVVRVEPGDKG